MKMKGTRLQWNIADVAHFPLIVDGSFFFALSFLCLYGTARMMENNRACLGIGRMWAKMIHIFP